MNVVLLGNGLRASSTTYIGDWCAASVTNDDDAPDDASDDDDDNGNDIVKCWKSLMDHLCNIHDDCYHAELSTLDARRKKWLIPGIFVK